MENNQGSRSEQKLLWGDRIRNASKDQVFVEMVRDSLRPCPLEMALTPRMLKNADLLPEDEPGPEDMVGV